jgi:Cd2+/Zn2+-exporting ATPase
MKRYSVKNLDCADCAARIERRITGLTAVRYASLNFASASLAIDTDDIDVVRAEIRKIEPAVEISTSSGEEKSESKKTDLIFLFALSTVYAGGFVLEHLFGHLGSGLPPVIIFIGVWITAGGRVVTTAVKNARQGKIFDENFLMSLATVGAVGIGAFSEAAGVMVFYRIGEFLETLALARSRRSIKALLSLKTESAEVVENGSTRRLPPEQVPVGAVLLVRPGERVPLDGVVRDGTSWMDTSALTGESVPRSAGPGTEVLAGMINGTGLLKILVTREYGESSVARILRLVEEAAGRKSKTERFMTRFAGYYTPAVLGIAFLTAAMPPLVFPGQLFVDWLYRALVVLVISCPCALVVSIPLGYFGGIGGAAKQGILVKGSNFIDVLAKVRTVVFDKTGTLTRGRFEVIDIQPAEGIDPDGLLQTAALAEGGSNHPIAMSLRARAGVDGFHRDGGLFEEVPGRGIRARVGGRNVLLGSGPFLLREGIALGYPRDSSPGAASGLPVHIAVDEKYAGTVVLGDRIRDGAADAVRSLRKLGVSSIVMLSGDIQKNAEDTARAVGIENVRGGLLPEGKALALEDIKKKSKGAVAFVGDGINDAPVLARADVGIAMGGIGQDAAVETADVVLLGDDLRKTAAALRIAGRTRRIVRQNIFFAVGTKILFVIAGLWGLSGMWEAVFADVGVAVLAVLNSMRAMKPPQVYHLVQEYPRRKDILRVEKHESEGKYGG